ncbi:MAG: aryl-sulfate sulfotransferase [Pseudomonadota bacterium]
MFTRSLLVGAALWGCNGAPEDSSPDEPDDSAAAGDCPIRDDLFTDIEAAPATIPLAQRVAWDSVLASEAKVRFTDGEVTLESPTCPAGSHQEAVLAGLGSEVEVTWQIRARDGDGWVCSAPRSYRAGSLDSDFPSLSVTLAGEGDHRPLCLVPLLTLETSFLVLFDRRGAVLWAARIHSNERRGIPDAVGSAFLTSEQAQDPSTGAQLSWITWEGRRSDAAVAMGGHTDVALLPDGSMATLGWDLRELDDDGQVRRILGDTLLEIGLDGQVREVWNVFDDFQPDLDQEYPTGWLPGDPTAEDWSHMNGLSYSPEDETYYVSISGIGLVAAVERSSGSLLWSLGSQGASVPAEPGLIASPHSIERLPDRDFLVFNRDTGACSHVDRFAVDPDAGTVEPLWRYTSPDCLRVDYLGDARLTSAGDVLVSWSSAGRLEEVDAAGDVRLAINAPLGWTFGFVEDLDAWPGFIQVP